MTYLVCNFLLGTLAVGEIKTDISLKVEEELTDSKRVISELVSEVIDANIFDVNKLGEDWDETTSDVLEIIRDSEYQGIVDVDIEIKDCEEWVVVHTEVNDVLIALDNVVMSNEDMIEEL